MMLMLSLIVELSNFAEDYHGNMRLVAVAKRSILTFVIKQVVWTPPSPQKQRIGLKLTQMAPGLRSQLQQPMEA